MLFKNLGKRKCVIITYKLCRLCHINHLYLHLCVCRFCKEHRTRGQCNAQDKNQYILRSFFALREKIISFSLSVIFSYNTPCT